MKYQENLYNRNNMNKFGLKNYHYPKLYGPYNPFQSKFSFFYRNFYFKDGKEIKINFFLHIIQEGIILLKDKIFHIIMKKNLKNQIQN
jgi:hypothetical protein